MAGTTLEVLRRRVVRGVRLFKSGTATGGAVGYLTDSGLLAIYDDNYFVGSGIVIITAGGAAPEGEKRIIQSGDQANTRVNVTIDFTAAPESGDTYEIYKGLLVEDVEEAINEAIRKAAAGFWEPQVDDSTLTWTASQYVYDLSSISPAIDPLYDIDYLGVQLISSPATYPFSDMSDRAVFYWDGTTPTIQFFEEMPSNAKIKISYRTRPTEMSAADDATGVTYAHLDVYLRAQAIEELAAGGFFGPESKDIDWRQERWGVQRAEDLFQRYRMPLPLERVKKIAHHIPIIPDGITVRVP